MATNIKLKLLRVSHDLTQEEFSARMGISRRMYSDVELGYRNGSRSFWKKLQREFNIPDAEMWGLAYGESCEEPHNGNAVD